MPRADNAHLNSRYACTRVIARLTGMTTTEIVEGALRGYVPQGASEPVDSLARRGPILVKPAQGRHVTQDEANQALDAVRGRDA